MPELYRQFIGKVSTVDEVKSFLATEGKFSIPLDVAGVVKYLGITLDGTPDFTNMTKLGSVSKSSQGVKLWYNPIENQVETRKRFTIAHELAHFFLHIATSEKDAIEDDAISFNRDDNWDKFEREANQFAASLLMPTENIFSKSRETIDEYKREKNVSKMPKENFVLRMSELFGVSKSTMEYRLETLGVL